MSDHPHTDYPARCCEDEPAQRVLEKLERNPPQRMDGESDQSIDQRRGAWRMAIERERRFLKEGR